MSKNTGSKEKKGNPNDPNEARLEELVVFSEDLIYLGTILSTISSALGLIGVSIARDVSRQREAGANVQEEAETAATFFAADLTSAAGIRATPGDGEAYSRYLYAQIRQMQGQLNRVNGEVKRIQEQLNRSYSGPGF